MSLVDRNNRGRKKELSLWLYSCCTLNVNFRFGIEKREAVLAGCYIVCMWVPQTSRLLPLWERRMKTFRLAAAVR